MKQVSLDGKLPRGLLLEKRKNGIKFDIETFKMTAEVDAKNEKRPKPKPQTQEPKTRNPHV